MLRILALSFFLAACESRPSYQTGLELWENFLQTRCHFENRPLPQGEAVRLMDNRGDLRVISPPSVYKVSCANGEVYYSLYR